MKRIDFKLSADRETLDLRVEGDSVSLKADEITELMRHLAWIRSTMVPAIPRVDITATTAMTAVPAVRWQVSEDPIPGQYRLHILHPGYGWVWIALDRADCDRIGKCGHLFLQAPATKQ